MKKGNVEIDREQRQNERYRKDMSGSVPRIRPS